MVPVQGLIAVSRISVARHIRPDPYFVVQMPALQSLYGWAKPRGRACAGMTILMA